MSWTIFFLVFGIIIAVYLAMSIKTAREYERSIVFRFGNFLAVKGPGLYHLIPFVDDEIVVDQRTKALDVPPQEVVTQDNVTVKVNAVVYFNVRDPADAVLNVERFGSATLQLAQTTLRGVVGERPLPEILSQRAAIGNELTRIVNARTSGWGVEVTGVELKDIELPDAMQRAFAREAEARIEARAKVVSAQGELDAAHPLKRAADHLGGNAVQLRYIQAITEIANDRTNTIVVPNGNVDPFIGDIADVTGGHGGDGPSAPPGETVVVPPPGV